MVSRIIGLATLGCMACLACVALPNISAADEQPIDYKAALSIYLGQSADANIAGAGANAGSPTGPAAPHYGPSPTAGGQAGQGTAFAPATPPATFAPSATQLPSSQSWPTASTPSPGFGTSPTNPASTRGSNFISPAMPNSLVAPTTPTNFTGQAIATQLPAGSSLVTPVAGATAPGTSGVPTPATTAVPKALPTPSSTAVPTMPTSPPTMIGSAENSFGSAGNLPFAPGPNGANGIVEQDGALFYLEPVYDEATPVISGEVPCFESCGPCVEESCGACCSQCCASLCGCRQSRWPFWLRGELLAWGVEGQYVPALLSRSPAGTPGNEIGVLSQPATQTVFGNDRIGDDLRIGGRVRGGIWFNQCRKLGLDGDFFYLGQDDDDLRVTSDSGELFGRPFINTNPAVNAEDAELLVAPRIASSNFLIDTSSEIYSAAPTFRWNAFCCEGTDCCCETTGSRLDFLAGYRYFRFNESIRLTESFQPSGAFFAPGTTYEFYDAYETENEFHGGELGLNYMMQRCRWILDLGSRIALGNMRSRYSVDGFSRVVVPDVVDQTVQGGFLTAGSRLGTYERDSFAVIPQAEINIGYCVTPNLRIHAGYSFIYIDSVIRPGSLITRRVDSDDFLTETIPAPTDQGPNPDEIEQGVWMQGVNFGFTYNF